MNPRPVLPKTTRAPLAGVALQMVCGVSSAACASADVEYGAYLAGPCVTCHQPTGRSSGGVPAIVAWPPDQFIAVMTSYRRKERDNEVMRTVAAALSDEEIAALAAYFGSLKTAGGP